MYATETLVTARVVELFESHPEGWTLNLHSLELADNGFAVGGWVRPHKGINSLEVVLGNAETLRDVTKLPEVFDYFRQLFERHWPDLLTHGWLGGWYHDGFFHLDSVELYRCDCDEHGYDGVTTRPYAISAGYRNEQKAIGHICNGYRTIELENNYA